MQSVNNSEIMLEQQKLLRLKKDMGKKKQQGVPTSLHKKKSTKRVLPHLFAQCEEG